VGEEVVRRAVEDNESLSGDERDVAVLFIDLVGSTQLTSTREPHEVAVVLNEFFQIVVAAVDERSGLINKFQGDAALAVFGAPLRTDDPATAALVTARALGVELRRLPVDFGIGVSAGPVFAGNIGAENRYEYTVVGDAVNEAARLADRAKDFDGRVLCSGGAIDRADEAERRCWARGRRDVAWSVAAHADLDAITTTPLTLASLVAPRVTYMAQTGTHLYVVAHSGQHDRSTRGYPGR
jgi:class 3 adenylate cyclase